MRVRNTTCWSITCCIYTHKTKKSDAFGNMVVMKRIKDNKLANGKLVLWSDDESGGKITLSNETEEIRRMYKVKYSIYNQ